MERVETEIVIVGGGIVGAAAAASLASRGHRCVLLERNDEPATEATGASAGMLGTQHEPPHPVHFALLSRAQAAWDALAARLEAETGVELDLVARPGARVTRSREVLEGFDAHAAALRGAGFAAEVIDGRELCRRLPALIGGAAGALWFATEQHLHPSRATLALTRVAERRGARLAFGAAVTRIDREAQGPRFRVDTTRGAFCGDFVVNAAGAWSAEVAGMLGLVVPVFPVRGQMLALDARAIELDAVVMADDVYFLRRPGGEMIVGSTTERVGFDKRVDGATIAMLRGAAERLVPAFAHCTTTRTWAGLRPGSADDHPILDAPESVPGFVLACGHFRDGILLGPITGEIIAALVEGERPPVDLAPYRLSRFASL